MRAYAALLLSSCLLAKTAWCQSTLPPDVEAAISADPGFGNSYEIKTPKDVFNRQILKVDVLTFDDDARLTMSAAGTAWVAIVAKRVQLKAPMDGNAILVNSGWIPTIWPFLERETNAPRGADGGQCQNGANAPRPGSIGDNGKAGDSIAPPPKLYFVVGELVDEFDTPLPQTLNFTFDTSGYRGGPGQFGGGGGLGGGGGSGGPAQWRGPSFKYPTGHCNCQSGIGGNGSLGGEGGKGGDGGSGTPAADIFWDAPAAVLTSLSYATVNNNGGPAGATGGGGQNGFSGLGGPRGSKVGNCPGGHDGLKPDGAGMPNPQTGNPGADFSNQKAKVFQAADTNVARFFTPR